MTKPDYSEVDYEGEGTARNPYEIENIAQLQYIGEQDLDAQYRLISDIDAQETAEWDDGRGFEPIGGENGKFTGRFYGNNHTISQLTIDRPEEDYVGLFSMVGGGSLVGGFFLRDTEVTGRKGVGGVAGHSSGAIHRVSVTGDFKSKVGVGGVVGGNFTGMITRCHSGGKVIGNEGDGPKGSIGGIVGGNKYGTVSKSYSTSDVRGNSLFGSGGLVGYHYDDSIVIESYATGDVEVGSSSDVGGLIGFNEYATIKQSYWDVEASGQDHSDGGKGLKTEEITGEAATCNMDGFDFDRTWEVVTNPDDYPILKWQM